MAERRFTRNVTRTVEAAAEATAGATARAVVAEETRELGARVTSLEDELAERRAAIKQRQNERVDVLSEQLTAETTWEALDEMIQVGAVRDGLVVSGNRDALYPLVSFEIQSYLEHPSHMYSAYNEPIRKLVVSVITEPRADEIGVPYFGWDWTELESLADVIAEIDAKLRRGGRMKDAKLLDPVTAASEFSRAMKLVKDDQQAPLGEELLRGVLLELHADDWAVTTLGLQNLSSRFFESWENLDVKTGFEARSLTLPTAPEGVAPERWPTLYQRLQNHAPGRGSGLF